MYLPRSANKTFALLVLLIPVTMSTTASIAAELGTDFRPSLGKPASAEFNSVVNIDGSGLPVGRGSVLEGKAIYDLRCAACHGIDGKQPGNEVVGGEGTLSTPRPVRTVGSYWPYATTLYDYIARAMPYNQEKSLSVNNIYAVSAYVLYMNGIIKENAILNQKSLPEITMPNRDGFVEVMPVQN